MRKILKISLLSFVLYMFAHGLVFAITPFEDPNANINPAGPAPVEQTLHQVVCNNISFVKNFSDLAYTVVYCFFNTAVEIILALSIVVFLWGIFRFLSSEEKKEEGKQFMFWSIIGIFVMVSLWGLVSILKSTITVNYDTLNNIPAIKIPDVLK